MVTTLSRFREIPSKNHTKQKAEKAKEESWRQRESSSEVLFKTHTDREKNKEWEVHANMNFISVAESDFKYARWLRLHRKPQHATKFNLQAYQSQHLSPRQRQPSLQGAIRAETHSSVWLHQAHSPNPLLLCGEEERSKTCNDACFASAEMAPSACEGRPDEGTFLLIS